MRGTTLHAAGDVLYEERPNPTIVEPTDAIVRTVAACVCGSDLRSGASQGMRLTICTLRAKRHGDAWRSALGSA